MKDNFFRNFWVKCFNNSRDSNPTAKDCNGELILDGDLVEITEDIYVKQDNPYLSPQLYQRGTILNDIKLTGKNEIQCAWSKDRINSRYVKKTSARNITFFNMIDDHDQDGIRHAIEAGQDINIRGIFGETPLISAIRRYKNLLPVHAQERLQKEYGQSLEKVKQNACAIVNILLSVGADAMLHNNGGWTALHICNRGCQSILEALIQAGSDPNALSFNGDTPLRHADAVATRVLLQAGAIVDKCGTDKQTPLSWTVRCNSLTIADDLDVARQLLQAGADVNAKDCIEHTPLHKACFSARNKSPELEVQMIQLLLDAGADVHAQDRQSTNPLLNSIVSGNSAVVRLLLENGAKNDINHPGYYGTPLYAACLHTLHSGPDSLNIIKQLLQAGADINAKSSHTLATPLHAACRAATNEMPALEIQIVQLLLDAGADIHAQDDTGSTPLIESARGGNSEVVRLLLTAGAGNDINHTGGYYGTPLQTICYFSRQANIVKLFIEAGADVNTRDEYGRTPICHVINRGGVTTTVLLLQAGAEPEMPDENGLTLLHWATGFIARKTKDSPESFQERIKYIDYNEEDDEFDHDPNNEWDFLGTVKALVVAGADINARSNAKIAHWKYGEPPHEFAGKTPLDFARLIGNDEVIQYLESIGAESAENQA